MLAGYSLLGKFNPSIEVTVYHNKNATSNIILNQSSQLYGWRPYNRIQRNSSKYVKFKEINCAKPKLW